MASGTRSDGQEVATHIARSRDLDVRDLVAPDADKVSRCDGALRDQPCPIALFQAIPRGFSPSFV